MKNFKIGRLLAPYFSYYMQYKNIKPLHINTFVGLKENINFPNDYILYHNYVYLGYIKKTNIQITN